MKKKKLNFNNEEHMKSIPINDTNIITVGYTASVSKHSFLTVARILI